MDRGPSEKSRKLSRFYNSIAQEYGCEFFETSTVIRSSDIGRVHFEEKDHEALGRAVAEIVKKILPA